MRYGGVTAEFLAIEVEKKITLPPIHKVSLTKKNKLNDLLTFFQMWFCSLDQEERSFDIDKEAFIEILLIDFA